MPPRPPGTVWRDLTESSRVAPWFGDLSESLRSSVTARLDFGDADFFAITNVETSEPGELRYMLRFLGTGPANWINWVVANDAFLRLLAETGNHVEFKEGGGEACVPDS